MKEQYSSIDEVFSQALLELRLEKPLYYSAVKLHLDGWKGEEAIKEIGCLISAYYYRVNHGKRFLRDVMEQFVPKKNQMGEVVFERI